MNKNSKILPVFKNQRISVLMQKVNKENKKSKKLGKENIIICTRMSQCYQNFSPNINIKKKMFEKPLKQFEVAVSEVGSDKLYSEE